MNKLYTFLGAMLIGLAPAMAQIDMSTFTETPANYNPDVVVMPQSPLSLQVLFVGDVDLVQTTNTYTNAPDSVPAKQWHDFIGFTPDETGQSLGWISVNHEMIQAEDNIGDGGGMTVFRVQRDANTDSLQVLYQELNDGRKGHFFNVDFVNTVGETGMNCGGITSVVDGRIWTAEEWFRTSTNSIYAGGNGVRDTSDFTVGTTTPNGFPGFDGTTFRKFENFNYMVEIDPKQAVAIQKQYNWGRQGFEGGIVMPDNQTVFLGVDATPAFWQKFVADAPGDFTAGTLYAYIENPAAGASHWVEINSDDKAGTLSIDAQCVAAGATMFNRVEWVALDTTTGMVYFTETGRDRPGSRWAGEFADGATHADHHIARATAQGVTDPNSGDYTDYYGRVMAFDPVTDELSVLLEGGPDFAADSVSLADYTNAGITKHLSNPDGLNVMMIGNQSYLVICEDLNGRSYGRVPEDVTSNSTCELFLLDLSIDNPTQEDLIRITVVPLGAEVTGACPMPDGKTLLVNSQHPTNDLTVNQFPFNNSLTFAITGFDQISSTTSIRDFFAQDRQSFKVFPNPVARTLYFEEATDAAIITLDGKRVRVVRNHDRVDVSDLAAGVYTILNLRTNESRKLVIE